MAEDDVQSVFGWSPGKVPVLEPARRDSIERAVPLLAINGVLLVPAMVCDETSKVRQRVGHVGRHTGRELRAMYQGTDKWGRVMIEALMLPMIRGREGGTLANRVTFRR